MKNKYFTAYDGTVYIAKSHIKEIIANLLKDRPNKKQCAHFAKLINIDLDSCHYREQIPEIANPDVDYFYCGGCRRGFPVKYTNEMVRMDFRPCPGCGAQAKLTPKLGSEDVENEEKSNTKSSRS